MKPHGCARHWLEKHTALSSRSSSQTVSSGSMTYTGSVDEGLGSGCGALSTVLCECAGMSTELKLSSILRAQLRGSDSAHVVAVSRSAVSGMV